MKKPGDIHLVRHINSANFFKSDGVLFNGIRKLCNVIEVG